MKRVVISDLHLTNSFDQGLYDLLLEITKDYDEIIINGDFWDGYLISFDGFLRSKWSGLFPYLKEKAVYTYGNHDPEIWQDERSMTFCKSVGDSYQVELPNKIRLRIQHGHRLHQYRGMTVEKHLLLRAIGIIPYILVNKYEKILSDMFGWEKFKYIWWEDRASDNSKLKEVSQKLLGKDEILVAGHIHLPIFTPEKGYINTGAITHGLASYLEVDGEDMRMIYKKY
ncbi:metallophosphoesterase [Candidatus Nomurabacteria bacterium]|uniref:Metallophosphoesterase n=1 Tax=Candidatus Dojkabacteria bacterium TaxID=2099670 RepID=A0A955I9K4_9BACT|nr:metallophosphoesterase [Candidatus Dojkabacteria bacterium]MCB9789482.1 metallophosphoesterase [Candidatus Nomurabacteria bacterium]MCB9803804.1 metallophosphoesterase [Candidatus Nomurabacteria bacterium]